MWRSPHLATWPDCVFTAQTEDGQPSPRCIVCGGIREAQSGCDANPLCKGA